MAKYPFKLAQLWHELKRRKVFKVIAMYAATAFIIMEAADIMLPRLGLPDWTVTLIIVLLIVGFPIALILSWIFDLTPEGFMKTDLEEAEGNKDITNQGRRKIINTNNIVIAILLAIACVLLYPKIFRQDKANNNTDAAMNSIELIAVLPFSNTRSDPETDYLGFAITDQVIGNLVYLQNISVRSSASVRKYDKQTIDPLVAGSELKVDYILSGNYLKETNLIRLNVELIKVSNNELIWREPIEVDFSSVFELQDFVAQKIVEGLNIQFSQQEMNRIGKDIPNNPLAYEYYLKSISYPFSNDGDRLAIEMLFKSIELDSTFAPAYAQLGDRLHRFAQYGLLSQEEINRSENFYLKALSINEDHIYALSNLAQIYTETARIEKAHHFIRKVLTITPNNAEAHFSLGYIYRYAGMNNEAVQEMERAVKIDPENPGFRSIITTYKFAGEFQKAFEISKIFKQSAYILGNQGSILLRQGNLVQAADYFNQSLEMDPDGLQALWVTGMKAYIDGKIETGLDALRKFEEANIIDPEAWYHFAGIYGLLGDRDGCIRALKRAVDAGFFNYPVMLNDLFLDSVRGDAEFQMVLELAKEKHLAFRAKFFNNKTSSDIG